MAGEMTLFLQPAGQAERPRRQTSSIRARTSVTTLVVKKCKVSLFYQDLIPSSLLAAAATLHI